MPALGELVRAGVNSFTVTKGVGDFSGVSGQIDMRKLTAAGLTTDEAGALRIAAAWIAVTVIADEVGSLKVKLVRRDDAERRPIRPPELRVLWEKPNADDDVMTWQVTNTLSMALYGVAYGKLGWSRRGVLEHIWPIDPSRASLRRLEDDALELRVTGMDEVLTNRPGRRPEFLNVPVYKLPGRLDPVSPVRMACDLLGLSKAYEETAAKLMGRGLAPSAVLTVDDELEPEASELLSRRLTRVHGAGSQTSGGVVVIGGKNAKLQPWTMSLVDAQWLAGNEAVFEIAMALWRVPPTVVGMVSKPSTWGTGIAEFARGLERFTLRPYVERMQSRYQATVPAWTPGFEDVQVKLPFESLLSASPKERSEIDRSRLMNGTTSIERVLARDDEPPFDDGETRFTQLALATEEDRRLGRIEKAAKAASALIAAGVSTADAFAAVGLDVVLGEPTPD